MAVYTEVTDEELRAFIADYAIGDVISCKGIAEGVENSNYLMVTTEGPYILTLYEKRVNPADLPFFLGLMRHLAARGIVCPQPVPGRDGVALRVLAGRPAVIVTFLTGMWPRRILPEHCAALGTALAQLHLAGADYAVARPNSLSLDGWRGLVAATREGADGVKPGLAAVLADELAALSALWPGHGGRPGLPQGIIHADLFPDNVFFRDGALSGLIDFYFACTDMLAYDLAICLNAWCFEADGAFNVTKSRLLLANYARVRPLSAAEVAALPLLARGSALRFLLTRLYDWLNTPAGALVKRKDPLEYLHKLRFHQQARGLADYGLAPGDLALADAP
ncbi:homoserine kinase [Nitrospirillum iridis]|uniref:Homoserine kinase n=1 Tax=Nitrospirillum iridis TaxID=765888 RepID=A0A7X0EC74_9PROT|nr:homoserine kinase [Nitrospirillum iridis]MBB6249721.1 homoserine kinase type II [Nitrospirillum iridis]